MDAVITTLTPLLPLLALILGLIVLVLLGFKLRAALKRRKEQHEVKQDLALWQQLSTLLGGKSERFKQEHSHRSQELKAKLHRDLATLRRSAGVSARAPLILVLGESGSGKSALCQALPGLTAVATNSPYYQLYRGPDRLYLEISGKVLFDHWLNGASALWQVVCVELSKLRPLPVGAALVLLPCDALLTDRPELTAQKSQILATALETLVTATGQELPLQVVISKSDLMGGLTHLMAAAQGQGATPSMGFDFSAAADAQAKLAALNATLQELSRAALLALRTTPTPQPTAQPTTAAFAAQAALYSLPTQFAALSPNLLTYLQALGTLPELTAHLPTQRLCFIAAAPQDQIISPEYARELGQDPAQLLLPFVQASKSPLLLGALSPEQLSALSAGAQWQARQRLKRTLPALAGAALLAALGLNYLATALLSSKQIFQPLQQDAAFYQGLATRFARGSIGHAALFEYRNSQAQTAFNEGMPDDPNLTRLGFFLNARERIGQGRALPLNYFPASLLVHGFDSNLNSQERRDLFNFIHVQQVLAPLCHVLSFEFQERGQPFTQAKAQALGALINAFNNASRPEASIAMMSELTDAALSYLYPNLDPRLHELFSSYSPLMPEYALALNVSSSSNPHYIMGVNRGLSDFTQAARDLSLYPELRFSQLRKVLRLCAQLIQCAQVFEQLNHQSELSAPDLETFHTTVHRFQTTAQALNGADLSFLAPLPDSAAPLATKTAAYVGARTNTSANASTAGALPSADRVAAAAAAPGLIELNRAATQYRERLNHDFARIQRALVGVSAAQRRFLIQDQNLIDLKQEQNQAQAQLRAEIAALNELMLQVQSHVLLTQLSAGSNQYLYQDLSVLLQQLDDLQHPTLVHAQNFPETLQQLQAQSTQVHAHLRQYAAHLEPDHWVRRTLPLIQRMYEAHWEQCLEQLLTQLWAYYPAGSDVRALQGFTELVARGFPQEATADASAAPTPQAPNNAPASAAITFEGDFLPAVTQELGYGFDERLARRALGPFYLDASYLRPNAQAILAPLTALNAAAAQDPKLKALLQAQPRYHELMALCNQYLNQYLLWWQQLPENVQPEIMDFAQLRQFARQTPAYIINAQLLALYDAAEDAVSSAPDNLLSARGQSLKHSAQQLLQTRLKVLTPEFTQIGTTTLAAWAALPADPYSAGRYLQALSEEELRAGLTAVSAESTLSIPWWHHFTARATALLGTASEAATSEVSSALLNALQAFPLVRQSDGATLTPERVAVLAQLLAQTDLSAYLLPPKEQPPQPTSSREQILALLQGQAAAPTPDLTQQHFETWLKTETKLLQLLTNKEQPLTAEITLPSASKQQELVAAHNQRSTLALMRYLEANAGISPGRRVSSASSQEQKLLTLQVSAEQLTLNLYEYSDSNAQKPAAHGLLQGPWLPLRLYLHPSSHYDAQQDCVYVPFTVSDRLGQKSVLYLKVKFNQSLPPPDEWPDRRTWPQLNALPL